jgi:hypothetical protein
VVVSGVVAEAETRMLDARSREESLFSLRAESGLESIASLEPDKLELDRVDVLED